MTKGAALCFVLAMPLINGCGDDSDADGPEGAMGGFTRVSDVPAVQYVSAVWSFGPADVWISAEAGRMLHFDGASWSETQLDTPVAMLDLWGFASGELWAVGGDTLARYDGADWTTTDLSAEAQGIEGLAAIWASSPDDVWVGGTQSTLAHYDGSSWTRYVAAGPENTEVWGSGPDDVYALSVFDLVHWEGTDWTAVEMDEMGSGAEGIWGFGADDVWVTSGSGEMAHYDGSAWSVEYLDFIAEASALWGSSPSDLWGVGSFGGILHYDGSSWSEMAHQEMGSPYLLQLHDIHGSGQGDVWILGTQLGEQGAEAHVYRR